MKGKHGHSLAPEPARAELKTVFLPCHWPNTWAGHSSCFSFSFPWRLNCWSIISIPQKETGPAPEPFAAHGIFPLISAGFKSTALYCLIKGMLSFEIYSISTQVKTSFGTYAWVNPPALFVLIKCFPSQLIQEIPAKLTQDLNTWKKEKNCISLTCCQTKADTEKTRKNIFWSFLQQETLKTISEGSTNFKPILLLLRELLRWKLF